LHDEPVVSTFLFTDIEGSTRLWEEFPERMRPALERHDELVRRVVAANRGEVVKMTGDGVHAVFADPADSIAAAVEMQLALREFPSDFGVDIAVRCGIHRGTCHRRDDDFFGAAVNRAARIMGAAHGGQALLSHGVAQAVGSRLPAGVALRDLGTVRLKDLSTPERVFQLLHEGLRAQFPALRSLQETPGNLPREWTSLVGRETECAQAVALLEANRLVTLVGMGGIGKTRLAIRVGAASSARYPDGVWFVELGAIRNGQEVPMAVALALGVKEQAGRPVVDALARHLADREALLVLDNCEHLLADCAQFSRRMLQEAPKLAILATSRELLHVPGEATLPLAALPVPDLRAPFDPLVLAQNDSVRLFLARARAARPDFEMTAANAVDIAAICHRLDGIPLALELAAARVRTLSIEQIAQRLTDRFRLLKGGDATLLARQRTLRALFDWSFDLLSEEERSMLCQLSVFAGGWTLEAAEAVCECEPGEGADLLGRLVDKSLVALDHGTGRYGLLETVRQYAQEHLDSSPGGDKVRARHLAFYAALAEEGKKGMMGPAQSDWLARLDGERENIVAAHACAGSTTGGATDGLRLISALKLYWINRGLLELGHRLTAEALARGGVAEASFARCKGLFDLGQIDYYSGRYRDARTSLEQGLAISRTLGNEKAVTTILLPLGMAVLGDGEPAEAQRYLEEAYALTRGLGDPREIAAAASHLGQLRRTQARNAEARELFGIAIDCALAQDDAESVAIARLNLAMLSIAEGDARAAAQALDDTLKVASSLQARRLGQGAVEVCAALEASRARWANAALLFGAAEAHGLATGIRREPPDERFLAPLMAAARAAGGPAYDAAEQEGRELTLDEAMRLATELAAHISATMVGSSTGQGLPLSITRTP
jgi:predicted ATPase/class 3 adenylate cyclase